MNLLELVSLDELDRMEHAENEKHQQTLAAIRAEKARRNGQPVSALPALGISGQRRDLQGAIRKSMPHLKKGSKVTKPMIRESLSKAGMADLLMRNGRPDPADPLGSMLSRCMKGKQPLLKMTRKNNGQEPAEYTLQRDWPGE